MRINRIDYCQFLLPTPINYTMTHFADHSRGLSHDSVNRLLRRDKLTGQIIWEHVKGDIVTSPNGYLVFDDTVLDKGHSHHIELVRRQYSGNAHGLIKGIGMVNCLYINPQTGQYWIMDDRIFDPDGDTKTKLECQCRKARIQRNHIACAVLVWIRLTALARKACITVYKLKHNMLSGYLRHELCSPSVRMAFA